MPGSGKSKQSSAPAAATPHYHGHRQRLRQRFLAAGSEALSDYEVLEQYRYTIAIIGLLLLLAPRLPGIGQQVNGAYLGVKIGPLAFQPAAQPSISQRDRSYRIRKLWL